MNLVHIFPYELISSILVAVFFMSILGMGRLSFFLKSPIYVIRVVVERLKMEMDNSKIEVENLKIEMKNLKIVVENLKIKVAHLSEKIATLQASNLVVKKVTTFEDIFL